MVSDILVFQVKQEVWLSCFFTLVPTLKVRSLILLLHPQMTPKLAPQLGSKLQTNKGQIISVNGICQG